MLVLDSKLMAGTTKVVQNGQVDLSLESLESKRIGINRSEKYMAYLWSEGRQKTFARTHNALCCLSAAAF